MIKKTIIATDDQGVVFGRRDQKHRSGKLWENCYKLHPLDLDVYYVVLRYIERLPLRAGMVADGADYPWSAASYHLSGDRR